MSNKQILKDSLHQPVPLDASSAIRRRRYSKEEFARRGNEIYERDIRPQVEAASKGKVVRQGSDVVTSINAGLRATIPTKTLLAAHDKLNGLLMAQGALTNLTPAIWSSMSYANKATALWRRRSAQTLKEYCARHRIGRYDPCPCGSGDSLRFCCEESLS